MIYPEHLPLREDYPRMTDGEFEDFFTEWDALVPTGRNRPVHWDEGYPPEVFVQEVLDDYEDDGFLGDPY